MRGPGRPRIEAELRRLVARMARDNPTGRALRMAGELARLGLRISEPAVSRYLPKRQPPSKSVQRWLTFLRSHRDAIATADFPNVTAEPTTEWVVEQLREAFPWGPHPRCPWQDGVSRVGW